MSGVSFNTATALWGRYDASVMVGLAESCCRHGLAEGYLSPEKAEAFIKEKRGNGA